MIRTFTTLDQQSFARLSGDFNPIHLDPVAARRMMFGGPVVHGVHGLLWAIDVLLRTLEYSERANGVFRIKSLTTSFRAPAMVDKSAELVIAQDNKGRWKLDLSRDQTRLQSSVIELEPERVSGPDDQGGLDASAFEFSECRNPSPADLPTLAGMFPLHLDRSLASELFPNAIRLLDARQFATLLATTRLIGMECPGQHSLFTGLRLVSGCEAGEAQLSYSTGEYDSRFSMMTLNVKGLGLSGTVTAAYRPTPATQAAYSEFRSLVRTDEFASVRALVIGGSRGLGEVAVKAFVAGGADVRFTYHSGASDARRLVEEITAANGRVSYFSYDVSTDDLKLPDDLASWSPTILLYFATPYIGSSGLKAFSNQKFLKFFDVYVEHFFTTFTTIVKLCPTLKVVVYPSSSTVEEMPPQLLEYFMAKSVGETLCGFLRKQYPAVHISAPRIPRLATDQTASLIANDAGDATTYIIQLLRSVAEKAKDGLEL